LKKKVEKGLKKGLKSGGGLSNSEAEVLGMLSEFNTIKKVAIRRNTSVQAIYKIVKNLKKKGFVGIGLKVENIKPTFKPSPFPIRLHGQEFNIQIIYKDERYKEMLKSSNLINIDNNSIRLYNDSIEVYSGQSFYADDTQKAFVKSLDYFNRLFVRLEDEFKILILKPRSQNIRLVNQHYAEVNNELAEETERQGDKIRVYTDDDGKLWFIIDHSLNCNEAETLHPETAKHDMGEVIKPFFNDLRTNKPPKLSELMVLCKEIIKINKETASGLNTVVSLMKREEQTLDDGKNNELVDYFG